MLAVALAACEGERVESGVADSGTDAVGDAPPGDAHKLADVGNAPAATGTAQQTHLLYAKHSARWWYFFVDSAAPGTLRSRWSTDFTTWTPAERFELAAPIDAEGRNFGVAYADVGGQDVVHVAIADVVGGVHGAYHLRARISDGKIAYGNQTLVTSTTEFFGSATDGIVPAVATDGRVYIATGWFNQRPMKGFDTTGNEDVYQSSSVDDGSANPTLSFGAGVLHFWVEQFVPTRILEPLGGGQMLAVFPTANLGGVDTSTLSWARSTDWRVETLFDGMGPQQDMSDWSVCAVSSTSAHAVRRLISEGSNDTFEHLRFDSMTGAWSPGGTVPRDPGTKGTGLVLLTNGTRMLLVAIASDAANTVRASRWDGNAWSAWFSLAASAQKRKFLSGTGCASRAHAAITWTEGAAAPYRVVGLDVTMQL